MDTTVPLQGSASGRRTRAASSSWRENSRGVGTIAGSFLGALLLAVIVSAINLLGVELNWIGFVLGATLLLAVMADTFSSKKME